MESAREMTSLMDERGVEHRSCPAMKPYRFMGVDSDDLDVDRMRALAVIGQQQQQHDDIAPAHRRPRSASCDSAWLMTVQRLSCYTCSGQQEPR